jgi:hypothetical protein
LEGGWCKPRVPPRIAKIRLRIIRVCRIDSVLIRMGRLKSPYDPSLIYTVLANPKRVACYLFGSFSFDVNRPHSLSLDLLF